MKLGTYMNGVKEIVVELAKALDGIEGDFDDKTLSKALDRCKEYPHTCDITNVKKEIDWANYINT